VNAWITIAPDNVVTIRIGQSEMGTGVLTCNAMIVAEELLCDWNKIRVEYASANRDVKEKAPEWTLKAPGTGDADPAGNGQATRESGVYRRNLAAAEITANYVAPNAVIAPSLGRSLAGGASNVTVSLFAPGTMYGDRINQVDFRVGKIFRYGNVRATPSLDVFNLLNANPVLAYSNAFATWQRPQQILNARFAKVSVQLDF
jgi:hypothetical protein